MANSHSLITRTFKSMKTKTLLTTLSISIRHSSTSAAQPEHSSSASSFTFSSDGVGGGDSSSINVRATPSMSDRRSPSSVTMPMSFMTGSIVGKRFYKKVTTREADDGVGWTVMLDYRTLKTPSKRPLKLPTLALAKAIAAEWEYQACNCEIEIDEVEPKDADMLLPFHHGTSKSPKLNHDDKFITRQWLVMCPMIRD